MKKDTLRAVAALAIALVVYLLIALLPPFMKNGTYWVSFVFSLVSFGVAGAALWFAFLRKGDARSRFYGFPIAKLAVLYFAVQLSLGLVMMLLAPWAPLWLAAILQVVLLAAALLGLIGAESVVEEIAVQDKKLKANVTVMRTLQAKVNTLCVQCPEPVAKQVRALAEELRYSDPVSSESLACIERDLMAAVDQLQAAVVDGDITAAEELCRQTTALLAERDRLCKLNK